MADDDVTDHQVQQQTTDRDNSTNLNMTTVTTTTPPPPPPPPQHAQEANVQIAAKGGYYAIQTES